jgi:hypothetical protein
MLPRRLALLAIPLAVSAAATSSWARNAPTVAVDLATLDVVTYQELDGLSLEKRVVVRLVQEGFAVVAPTEQPDIWRVCGEAFVVPMRSATIRAADAFTIGRSRLGLPRRAPWFRRGDRRAASAAPATAWVGGRRHRGG